MNEGMLDGSVDGDRSLEISIEFGE